MALAKDSETLDFDVPGELRFTPKAHSRARNSSIFGKMSTAVRQARDCGPLGNEKPEPDGLWFDFSSGEWIRTTDLRVMREEPGFGTVDLLTRRFSELIVLRFRRPLQTTVVDQRSYSKSFCGGSQALFCRFSAFLEWIQPLKPPLTRCRGST
jgi:hypothetical protein